MLSYSGKRALVTGASSGIGYELALELARRGTYVIATARRVERLIELQARCGGVQRCDIVAADLSITEQQDRIAALIAQKNVDIVINNAGRGSFGCFEQIPIADEREMVELNVNAFLTITSAALKHFKTRAPVDAQQAHKQPTGALLGVSSIAAFQPLPFLATYAATKAFEHHLYRAIRAELAAMGSDVHLTLLNPGPTATEFAGVARVPGTVTGGFRDSARLVASRALDALAKNRPFVVPSLYSKLLALSSRVTPTSLSTALSARALKQVLERIGKG